MKAVVVHNTGGPEVLAWEDVPDPEPGEGELAVEVRAAGVNFIDIYQRRGLYPVELPLIPGLEGAGVVIHLGEGSAGFAVGDRVAWVSVPGSYAERLVVPAEKTVAIPDHVDDRLAAAVLLQGITAHFLVTDTYPLGEGDLCLIHAGAGGVGLLLTQMAKMKGAEVVTTVGSQAKAELSREAGADMVVVYTEDDFKEAVEARYGPNRVDVVYDGVGASTFEKGLDLLRPRGLMVAFGNASGPPPDFSPLILARKGSLFLTRPTMAHYLQTRQELLQRVNDLFDMMADGRLQVRIGAVFPLHQSDQAQQALESRTTTGKVLLEVDTNLG